MIRVSVRTKTYATIVSKEFLSLQHIWVVRPLFHIMFSHGGYVLTSRWDDGDDMPTEIVSTSSPYYGRYYVNTGAFTNWTLHTYDSLYKQTNDVSHRVKPDPLTPTALAKQHTQRRKSSIVDYYPYYRGATLSAWHDRMSKGRVSQSTSAYNAPEPMWQNDLLDKIAESTVNLGSSLAEFRETGKSFVKFGSAVREAYLLTRGRATRHTEITPCSIAGADTAYAFGIAPLASDLFNATEALRLRLDEDVGFTYRMTKYSSLTTNLTQSGYTGVQVRHQKSDYINVRVQLRPKLGELTYGNPALWLWELTPWSWVFDYGIGVGAWLMQLDALRQVKSIKGTRTRRTVWALYYKKQDVSPIGPTYTGTQGKDIYKSHERFLQSSIPLPSLPKWSPSSTYNRVRRMTAVLVSVVSGRRESEISADPTKSYKLQPCKTARKRVRKHYKPKKP